MSDLALAAADAYCRRLTKGHYENFVVASGFVRGDIRLDLARIYAFCRTTDDLGDESATKEDAVERLQRWRTDVGAMLAGATPVHPVLFALRHTIARNTIAAEPFLDLIEANLQDQRVARYETWAQLEAYCRLSAAPVGRMVLAVFDVTDPRATGLSDDVCIGLQLANHAQDVKRDAAIGRRYLLDEDIAASGTAGAVRALVERARRLLDSGRMLEPMVHSALRLQLSLYRLGGLAICDTIERLEYRTDLKRPSVSTGKKMGILLRGALRLLRAGEGPRHVEAT